MPPASFPFTLPVRERRFDALSSDHPLEFQSTLPVRGATGADMLIALVLVFQSTLPVRGATKEPGDAPLGQAISIHAPREGSDIPPWPTPRPWPYFNPRSP